MKGNTHHDPTLDLTFALRKKQHYTADSLFARKPQVRSNTHGKKRAYYSGTARTICLMPFACFIFSLAFPEKKS